MDTAHSYTMRFAFLASLLLAAPLASAQAPWFPPGGIEDPNDGFDDEDEYPSWVRVLAEAECPWEWPEDFASGEDRFGRGEPVHQMFAAQCQAYLADVDEVEINELMNGLYAAAAERTEDTFAARGIDYRMEAQLAVSHSAWLTAREESCSFASASFLGGTGASYGMMKCYRDMTAQRLDWLRSMPSFGYLMQDPDDE